jgi:hypothetical protein
VPDHRGFHEPRSAPWFVPLPPATRDSSRDDASSSAPGRRRESARQCIVYPDRASRSDRLRDLAVSGDARRVLRCQLLSRHVFGPARLVPLAHRLLDGCPSVSPSSDAPRRAWSSRTSKQPSCH